MKLTKICLFCQSFYFSSAQPHYSDMTPGYDASIECWKDHWEYKPYRWNEKDYRQIMLTAQTCKDFQLCEQLAERDDIELLPEA